MAAAMTQEQLKQLLTYDATTGLFTWLVRPCKKYPAGMVAGCRHPNGYIRIAINGRLYGAHRLAWLYVHGQFPDGVIDHINRQRHDNRLANLRAVTRAQNQQNRGVNKNSTSGVNGVCWDQRTSKWKAHIMLNGRTICLGRHSTIGEAAHARAVGEGRMFTHAHQGAAQ